MDWITKDGKRFPVHNKANFQSHQPKERDLPIYMSRGFGNKGDWNMLVKGSGNKNNKYGEQPLVGIKRAEALKLKNNYNFKSVPTGYEGEVPESVYHLSGESKAFVRPKQKDDFSKYKGTVREEQVDSMDYNKLSDLIKEHEKLPDSALKNTLPYLKHKLKSKKLVKSDYEYDTSDKHQIPKTILDQLKASKVNGFGFFQYTGINDYVMLGNESVMLKNIPKNPNKITGVSVHYDAGRDAYNVYFEKGDFPQNHRTKAYKEIYVDQLSDIIVDELGVR